ncbi:MAG: hypothetical protein ACI4O7_05830 [Aristaeellaceae bacterium]
MSSRIVYLNDGEMGVINGGGASTLTSQRMAQYQRTLRQLEEQHAWKTSGAGAQFMGQTNPYAGADDQSAACRVTALTGLHGQLLYALTTPEMGGLYLKDPLDDGAQEGNWYSDRSFFVRDMDAHGGQIALALDSVGGECHIALMEEDRPAYRVITQGDTVDTAPWLSRREKDVLYYASVGNGRNEDGMILAQGPSAILRLNLATGGLTELMADDHTDYLRPREAPDGALYFIRRPCQQKGNRPLSLGEKAKNVGAFFRGVGMFFRAIADPKGAANSKPVLSGGAKAMHQNRTLEGQTLDVSLPADPAEQDRGCVPDSWALMRRAPDGMLTEVARGVADYAFDGDALVYSDGRRIFRVREGRREKLCQGTFISRLAVLED